MYVGTGIYKPEPATLRQLREAMAADVSGRKLQSIVTSAAPQRLHGGHARDVSTPPAGYKADHPRIELLKMKDIHAGRMFEPSVLYSVLGCCALGSKRRWPTSGPPVPDSSSRIPRW
jgi:hypothetical protein